MKYLTPQLYVEINQAQGDEVEELYRQWNAAGADARERLRQIKNKLPSKMQEFCDSICLHDADVLGINISGGGNGTRTPVAVISIRQDDSLMWLVYDLYREASIASPVSSNVFVNDIDRRQWLYDEVDALDEQKFRHEIMLNTGEVIELDFFHFDMFIHHSPTQAVQPELVQSA